MRQSRFKFAAQGKRRSTRRLWFAQARSGLFEAGSLKKEELGSRLVIVSGFTQRSKLENLDRTREACIARHVARLIADDTGGERAARSPIASMDCVVIRSPSL